MKVAVIILNYNGKNNTIECLASLTRPYTHDFELDIVVVDNGSADSSPDEIKKQFPQATVLINGENLGFAEGNNVGIRYVLKRNADFIFLLNNDTLVNRETVSELFLAAQSRTRGGIFGPKIYFEKGFETHKKRYKNAQLGKVLWYAGGKIDWDNVLASHRGVDEVDTGQYNEIVKTTYVSGCAMFIRRRVFETAGLLDKKYYLYYEDVDLCVRARKKGYEIYYIPLSRLWHKNAESSGGTGSDLQSYYITRNRLLFGIRYAPWKTKLVLMREAMNLLMHGSGTQRQAVGDFLRKKYGRRGVIFQWRIPNINLFKFFKNTRTQKPKDT